MRRRPSAANDCDCMPHLWPTSVAQPPVNCHGPLSEARLTDLVKNQVADKRLRVIVQTCGVGFALTDPVKSRLRAAQTVSINGRPAKPEETFQVAVLFLVEQNKQVEPL